MTYCPVSSQIAKHCDEPEAKECECGSSMTQHDGDVFLTCDINCKWSLSNEMTAEQYESEAKADHFSGEQFNGSL